MNSTPNFWAKRDLGDIINATFAFIKPRVQNLVVVILYTAGPFLLLSMTLTVWFQQSMVVPAFQDQAEDPFAVFEMFSDVRYYIAIIAGLIGTFVLYAAMYSFVFIEMDGETATVDSVWQRIKDDAGIHFTTYGGLFVLFALSIFINLIPCLGTLAWLGAAIYFSPVLLIFLPVRLHERTTFFEGFSRGNTLTKGEFGNGILLVIVLMIIVVVFSASIMLPTVFIGGIGNFLGMAGKTPLWANILISLMSVIVSLTYIIPVTASVLQYCNLVERKESRGLSDRLDSWGADSSEFTTPD